MPETTVIRDCDWVIAWDGAQHVYERDADVAFAGDTLVHVGGRFAGTADRVIDGRGCMVMPGLVNIHAHPGHEPAFRGIREEHGVPAHHMSGLFERSQAFPPIDAATRAACTEYAYAELLASGVTSIVDIGPLWDGWAELAGRSGLRAFLAPGFASARWTMTADGAIGYAWDERAGEARFAAALAFIDVLAGRLSGVVAPMQIDTCTEALLRRARAAATERALPMTVHIAQGVSEVEEMIRRHGRTPIRWAADVGILAPGTILGHAIFTDAHSWVRRAAVSEDVALIAARGASVAHCPTPFARYGHLLESFGGYRAAGINLGIGTDTAPHNLLEEMRKAATLARIAARDIDSVRLVHVLEAATVGGARALLRDDLGRLAARAKADLVVVDLAAPGMQPARDPLRSLVYHAADRAVRDVYVGGEQVVSAGRVLTLDAVGAAARIAQGQERMIAGVAARDYRGRSADEITPLSLDLGLNRSGSPRP